MSDPAKNKSAKTFTLAQLGFLLGTWRTEGKTAGEDAMKISGTDSYEWAAGRAFILHRVDVLMGSDKAEVVELIGWDESKQVYTLRSFDQDGNFTEMTATLNDSGVMMIKHKKMRARLSASSDGQSLHASWENTEDGHTWMPWMELTLSK